MQGCTLTTDVAAWTKSGADVLLEHHPVARRLLLLTAIFLLGYFGRCHFQEKGLGLRNMVCGSRGAYRLDCLPANDRSALFSGNDICRWDSSHGYLLQEAKSGARSFLTDALGNTIALADSSGTVQTQYTFEPSIPHPLCAHSRN